jgi:7-carboxy-7-deazaguanine synthase
MSDSIRINEFFYSIQGESTWAGRPCVFVRLTGCHLRCHYCDTEYAFHEGQSMSIDDCQQRVADIGGDCRLVEITGGEPLLQKGVHPLMAQLADRGYAVLIETSGACDISTCDPRVIRIMDLKTPSSGEEHRNHWPNIGHLAKRDEVKFVIGSREDYEWAKGAITEHGLANRVSALLMGAVQPMPAGREIQGHAGVPLADLAHWILEDHLPVILQTQLHKLIWPGVVRGV